MHWKCACERVKFTCFGTAMNLRTFSFNLILVITITI